MRMPALYTIALFLPLVAAFAAIAPMRRAYRSSIAHAILALSGLVGLAATAAYVGALTQGATPVVAVALAPLFFLYVTPLSAFFLGLVFVGVTLTSWYAQGYLPLYKQTYSISWLDFATSLFIFGMVATIMAGQPFSFLIAWEFMSIAAYFLIIADGSKDSLAAGFRYLLMAQLGFLSLMVGLLMLAGGNPFVSWAVVAHVAATLSPRALLGAFLLLLAGFGSKAGLVPLHQWLPSAHPQAPSHSSALLSGVMLKVALYGFILTLGLFPSVPVSWAVLVIVLGLLSAFFGVLHAVVENDTKRMLAWSSIENMGLLFAGIGLVLAVPNLPVGANAAALTAALTGFVALHALNHSLFKSGLFMATGAVVAQTHTRDLDRLGGLARAWPLFSGVFLVLALSAAALPPTGTFFGEWLLLQSLAVGFASSAPAVALSGALVLALVALVSGLAVFAFVKLFSVAFLGRARTSEAEQVSSMPRSLTLPPLVASALVLFSGLFAFPYLSRLPRTQVWHLPLASTVVPGASMSASIVFLALMLALVVVTAVYRTFARRSIRVTDTWDCGTPLTPRMQYTATGFSAPIRFFFRSLVLAQKQMVAEPVVSTNPWIATRRLSWTTESFWEAWLYRPVGKAALALSSFVRRLQNGAVQFYLALVFLTLIGVILYAL